MTIEELFLHVKSQGIVAVVREDSAEDAWNLAVCFAENGARTVEITMTTPEAASIIARLHERFADKGVVLAAGTVRSSDDAASARKAGAKILVSPHTDLRLVDYAMDHGLMSVAGALTPTEIVHAWEGGASIVKVYPVRHVGGPEYLKSIQQPIRGIPMIAGGPIGLDEIDAYLQAGAVAVNLGGPLAPRDLLKAAKWDEIATLVQRAVAIGQANQESSPDKMVVH